MANLYLFAIGGTGSRVLKSLVMLLSAGVEFNATRIKLMVIDPDTGGGDVTRTEHILEAYQRVHREIENQPQGNQNRFCKVPIEPMLPAGFRVSGVDELNEQGHQPPISDRDLQFASAFQEDSMTTPNKALFDAFYSNVERKDTLTVGSKGRQHIGALELVKFLDSPGFALALRDFQPDDRIFIISSVFGGTGASGFPVLLNKLRVGGPENQDYNNSVTAARKGAIIILPYFTLGVPEQNNVRDAIEPNTFAKNCIDPSTFNQKVLSTLTYYKNNLNGLSRLYYLGDKNVTPVYSNSNGGGTQRNPAHLIEFLAATAIVDFMAQTSMSNDTRYFEYGMSGEIGEVLDFSNLATNTRRKVQKPLTQFLLMSRYFDLDEYNLQPMWAKTRELGSVYNTDFYVAGLNSLKKFYLEWLQEMKDNKRHFIPFNLTPPDNEPFDIVNGIKTLKPNLESFRTTLAKTIDDVSFNAGLFPAFLELFWQATDKMVNGRKVAPKVQFPN